MVSVGVPPSAGDAELVALMGGAGDALAAAGAVLLGGDLSAADQWIVDVTVLGRAERPVSRAGARPGDGLWVSGQLGGARSALVQWRAGRDPDPVSRRRFAHPVPRLAVGRTLAGAGAGAMLDLSDGLGGDAGHLAVASGVGLEIDLARLPLDSGISAAAELEGVAAPVFAGRGGEDYELLAAMPAEFTAAAAASLAAATGVPLTRIGSVVAEPGVRFRLGDELVALAGFDHFS
jgi:thiamine-monophosphate kinase